MKDRLKIFQQYIYICVCVCFWVCFCVSVCARLYMCVWGMNVCVCVVSKYYPIHKHLKLFRHETDFGDFLFIYVSKMLIFTYALSRTFNTFSTVSRSKLDIGQRMQIQIDNIWALEGSVLCMPDWKIDRGSIPVVRHFLLWFITLRGMLLNSILRKCLKITDSHANICTHDE